jgi:hypothetical protein
VKNLVYACDYRRFGLNRLPRKRFSTRADKTIAFLMSLFGERGLVTLPHVTGSILL